MDYESKAARRFMSALENSDPILYRYLLSRGTTAPLGAVDDNDDDGGFFSNIVDSITGIVKKAPDIYSQYRTQRDADQAARNAQRLADLALSETHAEIIARQQRARDRAEIERLEYQRRQLVLRQEQVANATTPVTTIAIGVAALALVGLLAGMFV